MKENNNKKKNLGYYIGYAGGILIALCIAAIIVAFTARFIIWMF